MFGRDNLPQELEPYETKYEQVQRDLLLMKEFEESGGEISEIFLRDKRYLETQLKELNKIIGKLPSFTTPRIERSPTFEYLSEIMYFGFTFFMEPDMAFDLHERGDSEEKRFFTSLSKEEKMIFKEMWTLFQKPPNQPHSLTLETFKSYFDQPNHGSTLHKVLLDTAHGEDLVEDKRLLSLLNKLQKLWIEMQSKRSDASKTKWLGGSLSNWLEQNSDAEKFEKLKFSGNLKEKIEEKTRLGEILRRILRGIMKFLRELHVGSNKAHGDVTKHNVMITEDYGVVIVNPKQNLGSSRTEIASDFEGVKQIIWDITRFIERPKDIDHLMTSITRYSEGNGDEDLIYFHPSIWSDFETVSNIFVIRLDLYRHHEDNDLVERIREEVEKLMEEFNEWKNVTMPHRIYGEAYKKWKKRIEDLKQKGTISVIDQTILSFMRMVFVHADQYYEKKRDTSRIPSKKLRKVVRDMYLFFPEYLSNLMTVIHTLPNIKKILRSG